MQLQKVETSKNGVSMNTANRASMNTEVNDSKLLIYDKFYPRPFTEILMRKYRFWWKGEREPLLWFDKMFGLWRENGEALISWELRTSIRQLPDEQKKKNVIEEIIADVKQCSWRGSLLPEPPANLIPLANGVFDIEKEELREYTHEDYFTWKIPWQYNPHAKSKLIIPLIESFLPEEETITLFELMAYCLWRGYPYQKIFLLYGRGSNGKSLFAKILENLLGRSNVSNVSLKEIQSERFAACQLYRKLANVAPELDFEEIQNTRLLKQVCSEDSIETDRKFRDRVKFRNHAKMIFLTNEVPKSADTTEAFFRRLFLIEFPKRFKEDPDVELQVSSAPAEEYEALLFRVIETLKDLKKRNFIFSKHKPIEVVTEEYLKLSSPLLAFIDEHCEKTFAYQDYIFKVEFQEKFCQWLKEKGRTAYSLHRLTKEMTNLGFESSRKGKEYLWAWTGIKWKPDLQNIQNIHTLLINVPALYINNKTMDVLDVLDGNSSNSEQQQKADSGQQQDTGWQQKVDQQQDNPGYDQQQKDDGLGHQQVDSRQQQKDDENSNSIGADHGLDGQEDADNGAGQQDVDQSLAVLGQDQSLGQSATDSDNGSGEQQEDEFDRYYSLLLEQLQKHYEVGLIDFVKGSYPKLWQKLLQEEQGFLKSWTVRNWNLFKRHVQKYYKIWTQGYELFVCFRNDSELEKVQAQLQALGG